MNAPIRQLPRILVIAVWFGPLPAWFRLWLASCKSNSEIDWMLLTDASAEAYEIPQNVHVVRRQMNDVADRVARASGVEVHFEYAYKACDYRPLYWTLLDLVPGDWDFWGHCDMDMLFGNIRDFLTPEMLEAHDRVFGVGHFSIYRNSSFANNMYRRPHPALDYRSILSDPMPRGFDEHIGVNLLWRKQGDRFYEDEGHIADIDPHLGTLRRISTIAPVRNFRRQLFGFHRGRVFRSYYRLGRINFEEFMYMHFQKRKLSTTDLPANCESVWLTSHGFVPMVDPAPSLGDIERLNPASLVPGLEEISHRVRLEVRLRRRGRDYARSSAAGNHV